MGIAERARDALRPNNSLAPLSQPPPSPAQGLHCASLGVPAMDAGGLPAGAAKNVPASKRPAHASEPQAISARYYVEEKNGERRYFDDYTRSSLAMRATRTAISSKRQDLNTVRSMLELAQARGWQGVDIRGTAAFRREAWIEATVLGLQGRGFAASDVERQEAERRRAERGHDKPVGAPAVTVRPAPPGTAQAPAQQKPETEPAKPANPADSANPTLADHRKVLRESQKDLSGDGRLVLAALSEKIDRQMNRHSVEIRAEMKAFVALELGKKEWTEGPIVLSAAQKRVAAAPLPPAAKVQPAPAVVPPQEVRAPRRSLSR